MSGLAFDMFTQAVAGGVGGFASSFVLFPLDALKTKAQSGNAKENRSTLALIAKVHRDEGMAGFFRGAQWRGFQSFCEKFGFFYAYAFLNAAYVRLVGQVNPLATLLIGYCAEWAHAPLTMPIDTAVVRVITQKKSMFSIVREMAARPMDSYRGAAVFLLANTKVAVVFMLYEPLKRFFLARQGMAGGSCVTISARNAAICAGISRAVADTLLYPTRRIKVTRQSYKAQLERGEITKEQAAEMDRKGNFELMADMARAGGALSLFNGLFLELFRGVLSGSIMLSVKESLTLTVKIALWSAFGRLDAAVR